MLDEIAEKYNRPHRKTNALLSGLMYCPICGKRLRVLPESNRWTNGKPRFKYACPGVRAKECTFKGVEGVTLDEFVIHSLSSLQEEHSDYYRQLLENRVASMIRTDQSEKEYQETKKAIERLNADIAAQVRNLREADDALKRFIQDDIKELTDELAKREAALRRMEDTQSENQYLIHELNGMKKRLLSFEEFAKDAQPEALFTLVHSIVDRIYITTDGTKQKCQVYIKGCATEDYSDVLGAAGYIEEEPLLPVASYVPPMCDLDYYSIFKMSSSYIVLLVLGLCFVFIFVLLSFLRSDYTIYFALTSFLCLFLLSRYTDYIRMDKSVARLSIYKANCRALVDWMLENCEIELDNNLLERLIPRLERLAEDEKQKEEKSQKRMDDMLRLVLIPVILSTLTEIIKDQNLTTVISYSIAALTIFLCFA